MTIVEFLTARLDEDFSLTHRGDAECPCGDDPGAPRRADCPARWVSDITAKRAIVKLHSGSAGLCSWSQDGNDMHDEDDPCPTVRLLASVYSDHPDYREEWRP